MPENRGSIRGVGGSRLHEHAQRLGATLQRGKRLGHPILDLELELDCELPRFGEALHSV